MTHLNFIVEGTTEETFVRDVLSPHLIGFGVCTYARRILTGYNKQSKSPAKGGFLKYSMLRRDIVNWIESEKNRDDAYYTSFVDMYAFPVDDQSPYTPSVRTIADPYRRVEALEAAMAADIDHPRFIPYVQLHEFESLVLVEPDRLAEIYPDKRGAIGRITEEIRGLNPEEINETPQNAPSKRIIRHLKNYEDEKAFLGPLVAGDIGICKLRHKCPHFDKWISKLEELCGG
jgi:hypothetical protein